MQKIIHTLDAIILESNDFEKTYGYMRPLIESSCGKSQFGIAVYEGYQAIYENAMFDKLKSHAVKLLNAGVKFREHCKKIDSDNKRKRELDGDIATAAQKFREAFRGIMNNIKKNGKLKNSWIALALMVQMAGFFGGCSNNVDVQINDGNAVFSCDAGQGMIDGNHLQLKNSNGENIGTFTFAMDDNTVMDAVEDSIDANDASETDDGDEAESKKVEKKSAHSNHHRSNNKTIDSAKVSDAHNKYMEQHAQMIIDQKSADYADSDYHASPNDFKLMEKYPELADIYSQHHGGEYTSITELSHGLEHAKAQEGDRLDFIGDDSKDMISLTSELHGGDKEAKLVKYIEDHGMHVDPDENIGNQYMRAYLIEHGGDKSEILGMTNTELMDEYQRVEMNENGNDDGTNTAEYRRHVREMHGMNSEEDAVAASKAGEGTSEIEDDAEEWDDELETTDV